MLLNGILYPMSTHTKFHCPNCNGLRSCDIHGEIKEEWRHDLDDEFGNKSYGDVMHRLLMCRGCSTIFYHSQSKNTEVGEYDSDPVTGHVVFIPEVINTTYPAPESKTIPHWVSELFEKDNQLWIILNEMYRAYDYHLPILSAIGLRTAFDRATEVLGIEPSLTFKDKLDELKNGDWIGETEREMLDVVTDAGGAAAHRGWAPKAEEVRQLITVLEGFLQRALLTSSEALKIKTNIPQKPPRRKR